MKNIYLDNNATTSIAPEVREAMMPFLTDLWGNPSSMHTFGGQVQKYVERAREKVADLLNVDPSEIIFTSCGSESDNMAIRGSVESMGGHPHIVTNRVEHAAVLAMCQYLEKRGCPVTWLSVDTQGQLDLEELKHSLRPDTAIVSIMWANNETGVIFPIDDIARIVKAAGCTFHTDAVQAVGKILVDVKKTPIDMLALSGHNLHAPKGVGAIYIRKGTRVKTLRDKLEAGILRSCPDVRINGDRNRRLPNTLNVSFEYIEGESILLDLDEIGVATSSGSACTSGSLEPSHVMRAMGVPFTAAHGSIRFSLSRYNIEDDIDHVLKHIPSIVNRLRAMSPFVPSETK